MTVDDSITFSSDRVDIRSHEHCALSPTLPLCASFTQGLLSSSSTCSRGERVSIQICRMSEFWSGASRDTFVDDLHRTTGILQEVEERLEVLQSIVVAVLDYLEAGQEQGRGRIDSRPPTVASNSARSVRSALPCRLRLAGGERYGGFLPLRPLRTSSIGVRRNFATSFRPTHTPWACRL